MKRTLTTAQRRVLNSDDVAWEGFDATDLPVIVIADDPVALVGVPAGRYAITRAGVPTTVTEPVTA